MLFNSLTFLIFFPICVGLFFIAPKKVRVYFLLLCSLCFYMCWNVSYVLLLIASILVTYTAGRLIYKFNDNVKAKKLTVAASLFVNFGILFVFKYFNFFTDTLNKIFPGNEGNRFVTLNLLLPVGISFYIFQAVGYTIDVYRGAECERNIAKYALFVSFFPQLVAGPIERSKNLLKQISNLQTRKVFDKDMIVSGFLTMLYGYFMKMMIADRAAVLVNTVFDAAGYSNYSGFEVLLAAILFSVQIYGDFAGYTYIAIGAARVMGFTLCENFNAPYLAMDIKDFWNRWHISLSTWFKDYLYFPLGGSRKGKVRKYINIFIVFTVSGLWHGAAWHFVAWGVLHGIFRIAGEIAKDIRIKISKALHYNTDCFSHKVLRVITTFLTVTVLWMFFRAESVSMTLSMLGNMIKGFGLWQLTDNSLLNLGLDAKEMNVLVISVAFMCIMDIFKRRGKDVNALIMKQNVWFKFFIMLFGILAIVVFGIYGKTYNAADFIYFRF